MVEQQKYLVCIRCITYNHEKYLADALEGFVMQKTNFPFVAIVHDDASTDGTAAILRQYTEKYPDIIHPIYETENQYSKHDGSLGRIMDEAVAATGAKYIAMCEGDDYWTDPYKLQKQVDFMEKHEDYVICGHNGIVKHEATGVLRCFNDVLDKSTFDLFDVIQRDWFIPTCSIIYKLDEYKKTKIDKSFHNGDMALQLNILRMGGKLYYMQDFMGVYRAGVGVSSLDVGCVNIQRLLALFCYQQRISDQKYFETFQLRITKLENQLNEYQRMLKEQKHGRSFFYRVRFYLLRLISKCFCLRFPAVRIEKAYMHVSC